MATAEAEVDTIRRQAHDARTRAAELREQLAARPATEFGEDGATKPKTPAARLYRDLQATENPPVPWQRREQDAANRAAAARREVERFTADNIEDLVRARNPERDAKDQQIIDTIEQLYAMFDERLAFGREMADLLQPVPGLTPVQEIPNSDDIEAFRKTIRGFLAAGLRPALPISICTPEGIDAAARQDRRQRMGRDPARQRRPAPPAQARTAERARPHTTPSRPDQPPQPQPAGRGRLEEALDAILEQ